MEFDDLIGQGWARHAEETAAVAATLEEHESLADTAEKAGQLALLANHTMGEHLKDWPRARKLVGGLVERLKDEPEAAGTLSALAVCDYLCDETSAYQTSLNRAGELAKTGFEPTRIRVQMLIASGLLAAGKIDECSDLYRATLTDAAKLPDDSPANRSVAITSNNLAGELLEVKERSKAQNKLMLEAAVAARTFWLKAGDWVNDERADYLLASVQTAVGNHDEGLRTALRGLKTIVDNGEQSVDQAFLHLAAAAAQRGLGDTEQHASQIAKGVALAAKFEEDGLKEWFAGELKKAH